MSHREKREVWRQRMAAFYDSGLSASQFCAEHGLKPHQFWYWLRRLRNETVHDSQDTAFVSVVTTSSSSDASRSLLPLRIGSVEMDVRPDYDASTLAELVRLVMRVC
ncbi:IS66 family insertion sequence element accessory protein TnpB [Alicyclobacillus mali]|uniref:IS66 family insertion sequence element accessory protein TnpB n=2 Tax=Alicyclobacillus mali (ex Roth et al. 2021) TaxID=1123961 RepID=A0ABS0EYC9_9BACL|nr:IS66 family insertion sequence element accessory protein TnpB [Alicyclobacillus mali (ex Roth et al. 2021)]